MKEVERFLKRHWNGESPLLLGCSGGPDSKALLYALLEAGVRPLHVAHVDHGWREESGQEALLLQQEVEALGCRFHSTRLQPAAANREERAREGRMEFFQELFGRFPFQALLLGHQAGDLAETVLKRILEGAHLSFAGGMQPVSDWNGMAVWRPLLSMKKSELASFLQRKGLQPFLDPTNVDPAYLRARMRGEIFPFLNRSFGKEVMDNLIRFSERSYELKAYLERRIAAVPSLRGPWGSAFFLREVERMEARYVLQKHLTLSRPLLEEALDWVREGKANRQLAPQVKIDRGAVFLLAEDEPRFGEMAVSEGTHRLGDWTVAVQQTRGRPVTSDWKQVWLGRFSALVPVGQYVLRPAVSGRWSGGKIPAFFRNKVPILLREGGAAVEFLSGRSGDKEEVCYLISFTFSRL